MNGSWGTVDVEPNLPLHPEGSTVTLTATPIEGMYFGNWTIYDPCYPDDGNRVTLDANATTRIVMNTDMQVQAQFRCSSGVAPMLPLLGLGLGGLALPRRRRACG